MTAFFFAEKRAVVADERQDKQFIGANESKSEQKEAKASKPSKAFFALHYLCCL